MFEGAAGPFLCDPYIRFVEMAYPLKIPVCHLHSVANRCLFLTHLGIDFD